MARLINDAYPVRIKHMVMMNADFWMITLQQFLQVFFSKKSSTPSSVLGARSSSLFGTTDTSSTPRMSVLPQEWGGQVSRQEFEQRVSEKLRQRYELEDKFRLPTDDDDDDAALTLTSRSL